MKTIAERLRELGVEVPAMGKALGNYVPAVRTGNLVFCSGVLCVRGGVVTHKGKLGREQTVESAREAARICVLNALGNVASVAGLDEVRRMVSMTGFVNAVEGCVEMPAVMNGASDLLVEIFGEKGRHARVAVGVGALPLDATVEVQLVVEV